LFGGCKQPQTFSWVIAQLFSVPVVECLLYAS
jgi:hypothetical protein